MKKNIILAGLLLLSLAVMAYPKRWAADDSGTATPLLHPTRNGHFYIENPGPDTITVYLYEWVGRVRTLVLRVTLRPNSGADFPVLDGDEVEIQDRTSGNGITPRGTWDFI